MQYHNLFGDLQAVATLTHAVARATRRSTYTPASTTWAVTYSNEAPDVEIFAADHSRAVVVFQHGQIVFSAGRSGQVLSCQRGAWQNAVEMMCDEAKQAGVQSAVETACPWMDRIESSLDKWEIEP